MTALTIWVVWCLGYEGATRCHLKSVIMVYLMVTLHRLHYVCIIMHETMTSTFLNMANTQQHHMFQHWHIKGMLANENLWNLLYVCINVINSSLISKYQSKRLRVKVEIDIMLTGQNTLLGRYLINQWNVEKLPRASIQWSYKLQMIVFDNRLTSSIYL